MRSFISRLSLAHSREVARGYIDIPKVRPAAQPNANKTLDLEHVKNALVSSKFNACYETSGKAIPNTMLMRGDSRPINVSDMSVQTPLEVLDEAVFGGVFFDRHYGHFLTETLARAWPLFQGKFLSHTWIFRSAGKKPLEEIPTHLQDFFLALGFKGSIKLANSPILVKDLHIPSPANINGSSCHPIFRKMTKYLGSKLQYKPEISPYKDKKVYLSRSKLSNRLRKIENEKTLEKELSSHGTVIVHPETLSIGEQIDLFSNASILIGAVGSAFHTALLSQSDENTIAYLTNSSPPSTFHILDGACGINATYIPCLYKSIIRLKHNFNYVIDLDEALYNLEFILHSQLE